MTDKQRNDFWGRLGIPTEGVHLFSALREGLPYGVFPGLAAEAGIAKKALALSVSIPPMTLQRRSKAGAFSVVESDRLYRFAAVYKAALDCSGGDADKARRWIRQPIAEFGNKRPIDMLMTTAEVEAIRDWFSARDTDKVSK